MSTERTETLKDLHRKVTAIRADYSKRNTAAQKAMSSAFDSEEGTEAAKEFNATAYHMGAYTNVLLLIESEMAKPLPADSGEG